MGRLSNGGTILEAQRLSEVNKANSHKNVYPHRTGSHGYVRKYNEWEEMEEQVTRNGTTPQTANWIEQVKHYLYARGVTLSAHGSLIFKSNREEEVTQKIVDAHT